MRIALCRVNVSIYPQREEQDVASVVTVDLPVVVGTGFRQETNLRKISGLDGICPKRLAKLLF
jgi:hypothetical protein